MCNIGCATMFLFDASGWRCFLLMWVVHYAMCAALGLRQMPFRGQKTVD